MLPGLGQVKFCSRESHIIILTLMVIDSIVLRLSQETSTIAPKKAPSPFRTPIRTCLYARMENQKVQQSPLSSPNLMT